MPQARSQYKTHVAAEILTSVVKSTHITTAHVQSSHLATAALDKHIARGTKTSMVAANPLLVSTGLTSPVHAVATMRTSTAGGCPLISFGIKFIKASGSYIQFRIFGGANQQTIITGSYVSFAWHAFE